MNIFKDFVMPPLVLTIICVIVSFALVGTYSVTDPIIEQHAIEAAQIARSKVLPGSTSFEEVDVPEMPEGGIDCYKATDGGGYVITGSAKGYGGLMKVMVGIKNDGTIAGIQVLEQSETAGLGTRVTEPAFTNQFIGEDVQMKDIQTISGATISSKAFIKSVKTAYMIYGEVAGVSVKDEGEPHRELLPIQTAQKIFPDAKTLTRLENDLEAYRVNENTGHIIVTSEEGYLGNIVAAVGFENDGTIKNIVVTDISETPEYGMQVTNQSYLDQYIGHKDISDVETISGSTVTSEAFQKIVQKALDAFPAVKEAGAPVSLEMLQNMMHDVYGSQGDMVAIKGAKYALKGDKGTGVVMSTPGYGGDFEVVVLINNDGTIAKVALGKNQETPDYGQKTEEASYTDRYIGKSSTDDVEDIAGATITSKSFNYAVKQALELVKGAEEL